MFRDKGCMTSPYEILGISPGSDVSSAKRAFRAIVKTCHPDINPSNEARERFAAAENAYRTLTGAAASADRHLEHPLRSSRMIEIDLPVSIYIAAKGGIVKGSCPLGKANIKVPAGARKGDRIIASIGGKTVACVINIREEDGFRADGGDISSILRISNNQAKNGGYAEIDTPTGRYKVKLPENTPDGARLKVEGRGLPQTRDRKPGHLYLDVEITETVTDRAVAALDKILLMAKRPRKKDDGNDQEDIRISA